MTCSIPTSICAAVLSDSCAASIRRSYWSRCCRVFSNAL